ncbi:hypothetical protein ACDT16_13880, partial [Staphylococcus aureus]
LGSLQSLPEHGGWTFGISLNPAINIMAGQRSGQQLAVQISYQIRTSVLSSNRDPSSLNEEIYNQRPACAKPMASRV